MLDLGPAVFAVERTAKGETARTLVNLGGEATQVSLGEGWVELPDGNLLDPAPHLAPWGYLFARQR